METHSALDVRVARLETHLEHMSSNITRILAELHDLRTSMEARFELVNQKFEAVNQKFEAVNQKFEAVNQRFEVVNDRISGLHVSMSEKLGEIKVWALTVLGGGVGFGVLTVVARALHWI